MKKIIQILLICIAIAGIIVFSIKGFNVGINYSENIQININIGKEFNVTDIKNITDEIFKGKSVRIQQVELYKEMVQIIVKEASNEQIEQLNTKINEKYELENTVSEDIIISYIANTKLKDLVKPYILPISITAGLIILYIIIRFRKQGFWNIVYIALISIIAPQVILFSLYAITRLPINQITSIISIILYIISVTILINKLQKENKKEENDEKTQNI